MNTDKQDIAVLKHLAAQICEAQICDFHKKYYVDDCRFCQANYRVMVEAWDYGKNGRIPLSLAEKLLNGD